MFRLVYFGKEEIANMVKIAVGFIGTIKKTWNVDYRKQLQMAKKMNQQNHLLLGVLQKQKLKPRLPLKRKLEKARWRYFCQNYEKVGKKRAENRKEVA